MRGDGVVCVNRLAQVCWTRHKAGAGMRHQCRVSARCQGSASVRSADHGQAEAFGRAAPTKQLAVVLHAAPRRQVVGLTDAVQQRLLFLCTAQEPHAGRATECNQTQPEGSAIGVRGRGERVLKQLLVCAAGLGEPTLLEGSWKAEPPAVALTPQLGLAGCKDAVAPAATARTMRSFQCQAARAPRCLAHQLTLGVASKEWRARYHHLRQGLSPGDDQHAPPWGTDAHELAYELALVGHVLSALHGPHLRAVGAMAQRI